MTDMTAEERAKRLLNIVNHLLQEDTFYTNAELIIAHNIAEAEAAARRKALEETAACAGWVADVEGSWKENLTNRELHGLKQYWLGRTDGGKEILKAINKLMEKSNVL